ncbi:sensor histidine kinase [Lysinibacillus pakistanensis]|uniref:histidine kinase n=1 Tax=Lysinibacillus pakistanensis TaxID=759811 RepID=A0AAX3WS89_9BACI|nr:ATP-binding protein [Lysinibacillus pakistanensis]MDM5230080.1 ATP-binding protein [Lysinibacillus pakistanensis]WHY45678.1 ATP-binding protein [Lysinibacillus pakistanensis]WHY50686.1 ATP-binding protein [Lysinibacillus pakistanensis]
MYQRILLFLVLSSLWIFAVIRTQPFHLVDAQIHRNDYLNAILLILYNHSTNFIGLLFLCIGFYAYLKKPKAMIVQRFFQLMCITGIAITYAKLSSYQIQIASSIETLAISLAPFFLMHFFEYFPIPKARNHLSFFKWLTLIIAITITILDIVLLTPWAATLIPIMIILNILISIILCSYFLSRQWLSHTKWVQNQLRILVISLVLSFTPVLISMIQLSIFHLPSVPYEFSIISITLFPIALAYLLTKQEIINFSYLIRQLFPVFLACLITSAILIGLLQFSTQQFTAFIVGGGIFTFFYKSFKHIEEKQMVAKLQAIQQEKQHIFNQMNSEAFLPICAKRIAQLLHKMFDVEGVCIIWSQPTPAILYDSGLFQHSPTAQQDIQYYLQQQQNHTEILKQSLYHTLPLSNGTEINGIIIVGRKSNFTKWEKEELTLLKNIHVEAVQLFASALTIQKIDKITQEAQQTSQQLTNYNRQLLEAIEEERKQLSLFLHDDVLQQLLLVVRKIQIGSVDTIEQPLVETITTIRTMCHDLHPIMVEDLGLGLSIQSLQQKIQQQHAIDVHLTYDIDDERIPSFFAVHLFRMLKELLNNSIKHAEATYIHIALYDKQHELVMVVADNGKGFAIPEQQTLHAGEHFGLLTIQKKVEQLDGEFIIESQFNQHTTATITLPLKWSEQHVH